MSQPEPENGAPRRPPRGAGATPSIRMPGYGGYVLLIAIAILVLITLNTLLSDSKESAGIPAGARLPPFAVPLALSNVSGDANIATAPNQGAAGHVAACSVRSSQILNVCQLNEQAPLVLALFVNASSCPAVLSEMQALAPSFPGVRFAGVAVEGSRSGLRAMVRSRRLSLPVGIDSDGALVALYKVDSCPQLTFAYPGGIAQGKTVLGTPSATSLRARVAQLVGESRARGWREPVG